MRPLVYLGSFSSTGAIGDSIPVGDGSPEAVASTSLTLATSANATSDFYAGMAVFISNGSGIGQKRFIESYSTARVASLNKPWDDPRPDTASTYVLGVGTDRGDLAHLKTEWQTTTAATGSFAAAFLLQQQSKAVERMLSDSSSPSYFGTNTGISTSGATAHGNTVVLEFFPQHVQLFKPVLTAVPTAGQMHIFGVASKRRITQ